MDSFSPHRRIPVSPEQDHLYRPRDATMETMQALSLTNKAHDDKSNGSAVNSVPRLAAFDTLEYDIPGVT